MQKYINKNTYLYLGKSLSDPMKGWRELILKGERKLKMQKRCQNPKRDIWGCKSRGHARSTMAKGDVAIVRWDVVLKLEDLPRKHYSWLFSPSTLLSTYSSLFFFRSTPCNEADKIFLHLHALVKLLYLIKLHILDISIILCKSLFRLIVMKQGAHGIFLHENPSLYVIDKVTRVWQNRHSYHQVASQKNPSRQCKDFP